MKKTVLFQNGLSYKINLVYETTCFQLLNNLFSLIDFSIINDYQ